MPDFFIAMNYQGTLLEARKIKPTESLPEPWTHDDIISNRYGAVINNEMNEIGVTAITRAPDMVTAIRILDEVRAYDLLRKETIL